MPKGIPNKRPQVESAESGVPLVASRPSRADEVRQERRHKPGSTVANGIKLALDESKLDRNTYHYRLAADKPGRLQQLQAYDYDVAPEAAKSDGNGMGSVTTALAGVGEDGKPYNHVLMRKRRDWFETDQIEKQKPLDAMDEAIRRGNTSAQNTELKGPGVYTPNGVNIIDRAT